MKNIALFLLRITPYYFFVLILLVWGCKNNVVYHQYQSTSLSGWERNDTLSFSVPPLQQSGLYNSSIGLRINGSYPFTKLTLVIEKITFPSRRINIDTLQCNLMDDRGNVLGKGISYYQYEIPLTTFQATKGDSLHFVIKHGMKREILPGISDVGIKLQTR